MKEEQHEQVLTQVSEIFVNEKLEIGEAISIWWSLGLFLFSHMNKDANTKEKVFEAMNTYISNVQKDKSEAV